MSADSPSGPPHEHLSAAQRVYRNLGPLLGGKAAGGIISLVYMVIAARALGPRDYGVLVLIHGFVMAIDATVNFPGWQAVVRYGARPWAEGRIGFVLRLLRFTAAVELLFGVLAVLLAAVLLPIIAARLGWPPAARQFALPYSLAALATVRSTPYGYLQLMRRFDLLGIHNAITPAIRLAGAIAAVLFGLSLTAFLVAWLCAAVAECLSPWVMGFLLIRNRIGEEPLWAPLTDVRREAPGLGRFMFAVNAESTFGDLASRIIPLAVGSTLGPAAAGFFAIAQRATTIISQPGQILGQAAYVELAHLANHAGNGAQVRRALVRVIGIALVTALPVVLTLIFFAQPIVLLLGGAAFLPAAVPLVWLAAARAIFIIIPSTSSALVAMGHPGWSVLSNVICSIGLLPALLALMATEGLLGVGFFALMQALVNATLLLGLMERASRTAALPT